MNEDIKKALMENWGDKAESMNCYCEVKFIDDTLDEWACYVYAMNHSDGDSIKCIIDSIGDVIIFDWSLKELNEAFNCNGDPLREDPEFRRIRASELFKKLSGGI